MRAHIGKVIKRVCLEKRIATKTLAKALGVSRSAVDKMYRRAVIHPRWIPALNKALEHDLWQYYDSREAPDIPQIDPEEVAELKEHIAELEKELAYVKEINELLRKGQA